MNKATMYIDLKKMNENLNYYLNKYPSKKIIAVLKNNAYGLGMIRIAKYLDNKKIQMLAVVNIDEAKKLRQNEIKKDLLILGNINHNDLEYCLVQNITISITSVSQYHYLKKYKLPLKIHLKIDTGMHRLGIPHTRVNDIIHDIKSNSSFILTGIYTHYNGGNNMLDYIKEQQKLFDLSLEGINLDGLFIHDCSTNSVDLINSKYANGYRIGMGLYNHHQVVEIKVPIINIIKVKKYQCVSYNCSYACKENGYILTVPFGYGDGWNKRVKIHHRDYEQAGDMTMNFTMFFSKSYPENKIITLLGYGENSIDFYTMHYQTSSYEILSSLHSEIKRIYIDN